MKILVVDDEKHIQKLYREELTEEKYEVIVAENGSQAMELFERENPDLVTLDIVMPDTDGIKLLRSMKEKKPHTPIIMLTAYDYKDDFAIWVSDAYIVKSSDLAELKNTIKKLLNKQEKP